MRELTHHSYTSGITAVIEAPQAASVSPGETFPGEELMLAALRRGDEDAYITLLRRYYHAMLHRALRHVSNQEVAEEVVQEAWMGVFQSLQRFEGKCTLRTWIFSILVNCAQKRGAREKRCAPFSSVFTSFREGEEDEAAIDGELADPTGNSSPLFQKLLFCQERAMQPEEYLLVKELYTNIEGALELLPLPLRNILILRVLEEQSAEEVYRTYHISKTYQRVLLHRARVRIRALLEHYLLNEPASA